MNDIEFDVDLGDIDIGADFLDGVDLDGQF